MKPCFKILTPIALLVLSYASSIKAQSLSLPGYESLVCKESDAMGKSCAVAKQDPVLLAVEGAGELKISVIEDTRCPRFARCREPGRIILKLSVIEISGSETLPTEIEYKRNQDNSLQIELSDGSVLNIDLLAVTHKVSELPPELFEVKIGYTVDVM